jgi:hypothetical protein
MGARHLDRSHVSATNFSTSPAVHRRPVARCPYLELDNTRRSPGLPARSEVAVERPSGMTRSVRPRARTWALAVYVAASIGARGVYVTIGHWARPYVRW